MNNEPSNENRPTAAKTAWAKAFTRIAITAIFVAGIVFLIIYFLEFTGKAFKATDKAISNRMNEINQIASAFRKGTVTTEFTSYATKVYGSNYLQIAQLETVEMFSKRESSSYVWDIIVFNAEVEISAPVP